MQYRDVFSAMSGLCLVAMLQSDVCRDRVLRDSDESFPVAPQGSAHLPSSRLSFTMEKLSVNVQLLLPRRPEQEFQVGACLVRSVYEKPHYPLFDTLSAAIPPATSQRSVACVEVTDRLAYCSYVRSRRATGVECSA